MVYDPKKTRPKSSSTRSIVDQIIEEPTVTSTGDPISIDSKRPDQSAKEAIENALDPDVKHDVEVEDNVVELHPVDEETPLIMQPQVWIATGIAALLLLIVIKKRKKR